jgi:hypothetical protein
MILVNTKIYSVLLWNSFADIRIFKTECELILNIPLSTYAFKVEVNTEHSLQHNFVLFWEKLGFYKR